MATPPFFCGSLRILVVFFLLCCAAPSSQCVGQEIFLPAQTWSVSNLTILSISSPQCLSVWGAAVNCVLPAQLTIVTSEVPNSVSNSPWSPFVLRVTRMPWLSLALRLTLQQFSNNTWQSTLKLPGYVRPALNVSLAVSFASQYDYTQASPAFGGLSVLATPPPQLTAIGGCTGFGLSTTNCHAESDELLLYGSGFHWLEAVDRYYVQIGPTCSILSSQAWPTSLYIFNDSVAAYRLTDSYSTCASALPTLSTPPIPCALLH